MTKKELNHLASTDGKNGNKERREPRSPQFKLQDSVWNKLWRYASKDVINGLPTIQLFNMLTQYKKQDGKLNHEGDKGGLPPPPVILSSD